MSQRRMLLAFAHPDDESFGMGGVIAKYVDEGVSVSLICTTNGDVGTVPDEMRDQYDDIATLRLAELDCAASQLGFEHVVRFGYKDSGMMGAAENADPMCSWAVWQQRPAEIIDRVVRVIRELRPQVVVTFNRYGGYGHPDHIAIQQAATEAFSLAADDSYITDDLPPYRPQKLYYHSIPRFPIWIGVWLTRLQGKDPRRVGVNADIDLIAVLDNIEPSHAFVPIRAYLDAWERANACHASQGGGRSSFVPRWIRKLLAAKQGFTRVVPQPNGNQPTETSLFDGVTLD